MDSFQSGWNEAAAAKIIAQLNRRRMAASYAATAAKAKEEILAMIPAGTTVYRGGSMTTVSLGLWEAVARLPGVSVIDPYQAGLSPEQAMELRRQGLHADLMIASANAITLDGKVVNLDGTGNRVAAMIFGPKKVLLVVGMNKVASSLEAAMARVKHYSAPVNARRVGVDTPCVKTGLCSDCSSEKRICNAWSILEGSMVKDRIHIKLVGEELGY